MKSMLSNNAKQLNLEKASILVMDGSPHGLEILVQVLAGFGARGVERALTVPDAQKAIEKKPIDLLIADPDVPGEDGYRFLRDLRRSKRDPNYHVPIILVTGHTRVSNVHRSRDIGANMVIAKPISSKILFERILWVASDPRPFVEIEKFIGPDRRFKFTGPPPNTDGRREGDLPAQLGDAETPNMEQAAIDSIIKPQKVTL